MAVVGRAQLDLGVEVKEEEFVYICRGVMGHTPSLNQKGEDLNP